MPEQAIAVQTRRRGFAAMDPERQRVIARKGGKTAQTRGSAHRFTSEEAQRAGRKGGIAVSQNRNHMAEIGRRGGKARGGTEESQHGFSQQPMQEQQHEPASLQPSESGYESVSTRRNVHSYQI